MPVQTCVAGCAWNVGYIYHLGASFFEVVPLVEFMYLVFYTCQVSYYRWLLSLLLYLCYVFWALINSPVCWFSYLAWTPCPVKCKGSPQDDQTLLSVFYFVKAWTVCSSTHNIRHLSVVFCITPIQIHPWELLLYFTLTNSASVCSSPFLLLFLSQIQNQYIVGLDTELQLWRYTWISASSALCVANEADTCTDDLQDQKVMKQWHGHMCLVSQWFFWCRIHLTEIQWPWKWN